MAREEVKQGGYVEVNRPALRMAMTMNLLSNQRLATLAGVSKGTVGNILTSRNTCSEETAVKIAKALKLKPKDLFVMHLPSSVESTKLAA